MHCVLNFFKGVIDPMRDPTSPSDAIASSFNEIHFQPEDLDQHSYTSPDFQQQPSSNSLFNPPPQVQQQQGIPEGTQAARRRGSRDCKPCSESNHEPTE